MRVKITDFGTAKLMSTTANDENESEQSRWTSICDDAHLRTSRRPSETSIKILRRHARIRLARDPLREEGVVTLVRASADTLARAFADSGPYRRSDYWGFGCILYQILAGRPPFQARTEYLMFQKIINLEYEFPLGFPADAKDLVEKLLVGHLLPRLGLGAWLTSRPPARS